METGTPRPLPPSKRIDSRALPHSVLATERHLKLHCYGRPGARPKAYIQAALHADELPGMLAAHHLLRLIDAADARGEILGQIVVVPVVNPIGMGQMLNGSHVGQADLRSGGNFNRNWPPLADDLARNLGDRLTADPVENVQLVRAELARRIAALAVTSEFAWLQREICGIAHDADFVLDLHCDDDALPHLYTMPQFWPDLADLAADVGAKACLLCDDSKSNCFDETFSLPWTRLAKAMGDRFPIPLACVTATLEFRGQPDVYDDLAAADAAGLYRFLQRRGLVRGMPDAPAATEIETAMLDATDIVEAPHGGIVAYRVRPGDRVEKGDVIAYLVDPLSDCAEDSRLPIRASVGGLVLSGRQSKLVALGDYIAVIVGKESLARRQARLMTD